MPLYVCRLKVNCLTINSITMYGLHMYIRILNYNTNGLHSVNVIYSNNSVRYTSALAWPLLAANKSVV